MNAGRAIEALLIMATEPLAAADLAAQLGLPERDVTAELEQLSRFYQDTSRGFELRRVAGGWRLATAPDLAETLEAAVVAETRARLSQAALAACHPRPGFRGAWRERRRRGQDSVVAWADHRGRRGTERGHDLRDHIAVLAETRNRLAG